MKIKSLLASLLLLSSSAVTVSAARLTAPRAPKISASTCSDLPLRVALLKAQEEMRALLPGKAGPGEVQRAMESDPGFNRRVKEVFATSDVVKSEFSRDGGCVVTVKLSLDRLQSLTGAVASVN